MSMRGREQTPLRPHTHLNYEAGQIYKHLPHEKANRLHTQTHTHVPPSLNIFDLGQIALYYVNPNRPRLLSQITLTHTPDLKRRA